VNNLQATEYPVQKNRVSAKSFERGSKQDEARKQQDETKTGKTGSTTFPSLYNMQSLSTPIPSQAGPSKTYAPSSSTTDGIVLTADESRARTGAGVEGMLSAMHEFL